MLNSDTRLLVLAAHPDDEVLMAGGVLSKLRAIGGAAMIAIAATGATSRNPVYEDAAIRTLEKETQDAMTCLGWSDIKIARGGFPDNQMDTIALLEIIKWVESVIRDFRPTLVITHCLGCTNIDHRLCFEAATVAVRPSSEQHIELWTAETPSSSGYRRPWNFEPSLYVALKEAEIKAKIAAMQCYESESRVTPNPRSPEMLNALSHVRGSEAGCSFAEAFMLIRGFA